MAMKRKYKYPRRVPHLKFENPFNLKTALMLLSGPVASPRTAHLETKHSSRAREMVFVLASLVLAPFLDPLAERVEEGMP
jgi:hypothetical protein